MNADYDENEYYHSAIWGNFQYGLEAPDSGVMSLEAGHLRYEKGRGVVKTEEADCSYCVAEGLNDGRWHTERKQNEQQH